MKNSTKLKLALLKEFRDGENAVRLGMKAYEPHSEENEYFCENCKYPMMYEDEMCKECGYMQETQDLEEEKHEVFMAQKNLETIIKSATELLSKLGTEEREVPAWVADHITKSETYIEQANDGFYFEDEQGDEEPEQDMSLTNLMEATDSKGLEVRNYKTGVTVKTNLSTGTTYLSKPGMKSVTIKKNRLRRFKNPIKGAKPLEIDTLGELMRMYLNGDLTSKESVDETKKKPAKFIQKAINPAHKGDLHTALHVAKDKKIPAAKLNKATHSENPHLRHMAQFAKNIKHK